MPKKLFPIVAAVLALLLAGSAALLALTLQAAPSVAAKPEPDPDDVARALALLRAHDPRRAVPGEARTVRLSERDLDVLLNHAAARFLGPALHVSLAPGAARVEASLALPPPVSALRVFGGWLNLEARLSQGDGGPPAVDAWRIGSLPLPGWLAERLLQRAAVAAGLGAEVALAGSVVRSIGFGARQLAVTYAWAPDSLARVYSTLLPADDQPRLAAYTGLLARQTQALQPAWESSLAPLLGPLFALARQRSAEPGADAVAENRALLVVLALFVNGRDPGALLPAAQRWPQPAPLRLTLEGRDDFAQHFLVSAALAAEGTGPLSKAIGVYKEVADSRGGSGFSFNDMAANRAGTRFGERAVREPQALQALLAGGVTETAFMPAVADLPQFMDEAEFKRRFGGIGAAPYQALMADIENRVSALAVLR